MSSLLQPCPPALTAHGGGGGATPPARLHLGFLDPVGQRWAAGSAASGVVIDGLRRPQLDTRPRGRCGHPLSLTTPAAQAELRARWPPTWQRLRERTAACTPAAAPAPEAGAARRTPASAPARSSRWRWARAFARCHRPGPVDATTLAAWLGRGRAFRHRHRRLRPRRPASSTAARGADGSAGAGAVAPADLPEGLARHRSCMDERIAGPVGATPNVQALARVVTAAGRTAAADLCHQVLMRVLAGRGQWRTSPPSPPA